MSDVGEKTVPDKGRLNRERPLTKVIEFQFCTGKSFFLIGSGTESTRWSYIFMFRWLPTRETE